jgi:hypothetical protein
LKIDLEALAAEYGVTLSDKEKALKPAAEIKAEREKEHRQELEAGTLLLQSLHYKHQPAMLVCRNCGRSFLSNYCREWFCSRHCMVLDFEKHFGVAWDRIKPPASYWENEPAIRVSPDQTDMLYEWCRAFVEQYETTGKDQEPEASVLPVDLLLAEDPADTFQTEPIQSDNPPTDPDSEGYEAQANLLQLLSEQVDPFAD